jgi:outer membrane protein TolC
MYSAFLLAVLLFLPRQAEAKSDVLTLDEAVQEVLAANEDVRAAGFRVEAAKARIPQAKGLDDPMVGVTFEDVPFGSGISKGEEINYRIEQKFPFPGKRGVRGKTARFDADAVSENSRGRVQDILLDLKTTYYDLYRSERSLAVNREIQGLLRRLLGSTEEAYATGKTSAAAPIKAQVELSKLQNDQILLDQERRTHMAHLKALLHHGDYDDDEFKLPSKLDWPHLTASLEEIEATAAESRPELGQLRAMEKRDAEKVVSAKQSLIPDFAFAFEYNQVPDFVDHWTGTAAVNVPIFWGKNRGRIREAQASLKVTQAEHRSLEIHTRHEIEQAYGAVKAAQKVVGSYQSKILPQARAMLEISRSAYASSQIDFLTLIDAARAYKDLQMSFYENLARLGTSHAQLERLVGREL